MRRLILALAFLALAAPVPANASTPLPWCGTDVSAFDRAPDASPAFEIHVIYAYPADAPDRFAGWAPRIVGDMAAIDAWWRSQDPARAPRFDLHDFGCASVAGSLDLSRVPLPTPVPDVRTAFTRIRQLLAAEFAFRQPEKVYLVYFDGPTGQSGRERICGEADEGRRGFSALAVVYLDSCGSDERDDTRVIVSAHELVHALGAVDDRFAPNGCSQGHVCDAANDLMTAALGDGPLETRVLDVGGDDYYGHRRPWDDLRDSRYLERFDSPDRDPPSVPTRPTITSDRSGAVRFSWAPSTDDASPLSYRISRDGAFYDETDETTTVIGALIGSTSVYAVRAVDGVGRLSAVVSLRFTAGLGIVDANGKLIRDTVPPDRVTAVVVRKLRKRVVLTWSAARDGGGILGYRVRIGSRRLTTRKEVLSLARSSLRGAVKITAVDLAGNAGPTTTISLRRLR